MGGPKVSGIEVGVTVLDPEAEVILESICEEPVGVVVVVVVSCVVELLVVIVVVVEVVVVVVVVVMKPFM